MNKITVIVPVYNNASFIERCLLSIVNQSYKNIEIIVINDGSTDDSLKIINEIATIDNRIIIINQENQGVSAARNTGLEVATGDYIGFVDSDDYVENRMYKKMLETAIEYNADIVECNYKKVDNNNNIIVKSNLEFSIIKENYTIVKKYLNNENTLNFNWNKLYKKEIIEGLYYPDFNYSEDYYFNVSVFLNSNVKITIPDQLYTQISHDMSAVNQAFSEKKFDIIKSGLEVNEIIKKKYSTLSIYSTIYILRNIFSMYQQIKTISGITDNDTYLKELISLYNTLFDQVYKNIIESDAPFKLKIILLCFRINPSLSNRLKKLNNKMKSF